jgi:transcriptional regulator with XRE-family HTH domain
MTDNQIVGQNIKKFRDSLRITQEVFAAYLGITREEVSYFENGKRNISSNLITKSAQLFSIDEYDLYEVDSNVNQLNLAFAFRTEGLLKEDLDSIAHFKNIARNYLKMKKALYNND